MSEMLLIFGMVGWARFGAWAGVFAGLAGAAALVLSVLARRKVALPLGTLAGFVITSLAAVSLSIFLMIWGLGP
jgi:hypothetical protein